jgi:hypothetical protein
VSRSFVIYVEIFCNILPVRKNATLTHIYGKFGRVHKNRTTNRTNLKLWRYQSDASLHGSSCARPLFCFKLGLNNELPQFIISSDHPFKSYGSRQIFLTVIQRKKVPVFFFSPGHLLYHIQPAVSSIAPG